MKFLSLLLAMCISLNVLASTAPIEQLEKSFDEYQFKMTVEWDQKDQVYYEKETQSFFSELESLMTKGLVKQDFAKLLEKKVGDKKALEALKFKLSMLDKVDSSEELSKVLQTHSKELYSKGASWNGETTLIYGAIIATVAYFAYEVWFYSTHECVSYNEGYTCGYPSEVMGMQCYTYEYCELYDTKK